jgi:hypothetical protein
VEVSDSTARPKQSISLLSRKIFTTILITTTPAPDPFRIALKSSDRCKLNSLSTLPLLCLSSLVRRSNPCGRPFNVVLPLQELHQTHPTLLS